jgi:probable F420-dependent oxidoreductase
VSFAGMFFTVDGASVGPRPAKPLDIWLGGSAPGALRRVGRFGDGWLGSFLTPAEAGAGRVTIEEAAAGAGREVEPDHYGISLAVATDGIPDALIAAVRDRRPGVDPASLVAGSWADARRMIEQYVAQGLTKFVVRPASATTSLSEFLSRFAAELMPLQT